MNVVNEVSPSDEGAVLMPLLCCPFCGGNAALEYEWTTNRYHSDYKDNYTVRCETLRCFGRTSVWKAYHEKEDAIKQWNTRAT